jgi:hypothetical protein
MATDFELEVCKQLPLAEAVMVVSNYVLSDESLAEMYETHRGRSYEKIITFPLFVRLISDALLVHDGKGHQAFKRAIEDDELTTSLQAAYQKLQRVPNQLSEGFLTDSTARLRDIFPANALSNVPSSLKNYTVINVDGKKLKHLEMRMAVTRGLKGSVFGGKLVVGMDQRTGLTLAMSSDLDGEVADQPLVPGLLSQIRQYDLGPVLYVEDRGFCDLVQPSLLCEGEFFLMRHHPKVSFHLDHSKSKVCGKDSKGRKYKEEWGWLGKPDDPRRVYVRKITVFENGKERLVLVTNLLNAKKIPGSDLLDVYTHRWDIEQLFQRTTEVFSLNALISSTPQATIFQAAYCFLISNIIATIRAYLAASQEIQPSDVSAYEVHYDTRQELIAWLKLINAEATADLTEGAQTPGRIRQCLKSLMSRAWTNRYMKAPSTKHTPVEKKKYIPGGHTSMERLLNRKKTSKQSC